MLFSVKIRAVFLHANNSSRRCSSWRIAKIKFIVVITATQDIRIIKFQNASENRKRPEIIRFRGISLKIEIKNNPNTSPVRKIRFGLYCLGAGDRTWTGTMLPSRDFKSLASAYSATPARWKILYSIKGVLSRGENIKTREFCRVANSFMKFWYKKLLFFIFCAILLYNYFI